MPKIQVDYKHTVIYKIICNDLSITDCYVGHTTNFIKRKYQHKINCENQNDVKYNFKIYTIIRQNGGWQNWTMVEIEKYPCNDRNEAIARERYWFELNSAKLNTVVPSRTVKEYRKEYYKINKQQLLEQKKQVICCELCQSEVTVNHLARHKKTNKCLKQCQTNPTSI